MVKLDSLVNVSVSDNTIGSF
ncbi:hypothetical protein DSUL_170039 [Desulfovibrionales bacterium]